MPTNIVPGKLRTRHGRKWGAPSMLLATPDLAVANILTILIGRGAPGWFHRLMLLCIWNAFKFLVIGPVSVVLLVRIRTAERRDRRRLSLSPPRSDYHVTPAGALAHLLSVVAPQRSRQRPVTIPSHHGMQQVVVAITASKASHKPPLTCSSDR